MGKVAAVGEAAGHKFGQLIGEYCEAAIEPLLQEFAERHGLYLDKKGPRPARPGRKVRWFDVYGNAHDLDYVLERGGTPERVGVPVAFIESAWRRYTKHSRNKAQEIQAAVLPTAQKYKNAAPFLGCFLVGVYTSAALDQLRSAGFRVLYFPYDSVLEAFATVGIDTGFEETTPDRTFRTKLRQWNRLPLHQKTRVWERLLELNREAVEDFMDALERSVERRLLVVRVVPLHGTAVELPSLDQAIQFVACYTEGEAGGPLLRYEIQIRYDNGDRVDGEFRDRQSAIEFLRSFAGGNWLPAAD
jgi:hypothetical protein